MAKFIKVTNRNKKVLKKNESNELIINIDNISFIEPEKNEITMVSLHQSGYGSTSHTFVIDEMDMSRLLAMIN
ncbi:hypothetical protein M2475_001001 [Breznakia sp. PF5-3]|uniref:hypothetical protein n=1 Tax=unclassified Breznakia TaxID=2623764 RepID=UPI0024052071|nr:MULTISPECIES: hypothetical protein [unclassified Breznakia]MDF9825758.1 hypothetical protein [Breznakia sp. PM6-1]MDF9835436.1 hypothetical protein [Breznakia sp. PF5-3]MDF9837668.1 hypothetical protein [Breznakia sp. PFB2-8]MDF9859532.1 hypothetical protein [Breznakia sp. PH5-24]